MNEYLTRHAFGGPKWTDPGLWDTRLTLRGEREAASTLRRALAAVHERDPIELCVSSPLTRAMATAHLGLGSLDVPRQLTPLLAERRYASSDVGRPAAQLADEFPLFFPAAGGVAALGERWWWSGSTCEPSGGGAPGAFLAIEPQDDFLGRTRGFQLWIRDRRERRIAAVAHWGVWYSLLGGRSLSNCEVIELDLDALIAYWDEVPLIAPP
jgi:broad specificity phosphatase PhoE